MAEKKEDRAANKKKRRVFAFLTEEERAALQHQITELQPKSSREAPMAAEHAGAAGPDPNAWDAGYRAGRDSVQRQLRSRIASLEAENARLYEGWPELGSPNNERLPYPVAGEWRFDQFIPGEGWEWAGPFATKREAVQANLGLDAPTGGGE